MTFERKVLEMDDEGVDDHLERRSPGGGITPVIVAAQDVARRVLASLRS